MPEYLVVFNLGEAGVNTDLSPLHLAINHFRKTQNAIADNQAIGLGIRSRHGLIKFNENEAANGAVLGGANVPLQNVFTGTRFFYLGRGPLS
jgi:hypothetical protein